MGAWRRWRGALVVGRFAGGVAGVTSGCGRPIRGGGDVGAFGECLSGFLGEGELAPLSGGVIEEWDQWAKKHLWGFCVRGALLARWGSCNCSVTLRVSCSGKPRLDCSDIRRQVRNVFSRVNGLRP